MHLLVIIFLLTLFPVSLQAAAPARSGQPYAESICNTNPDIILCEDFDYPENFACVSGNPGTNTWVNPGLSAVAYSDCSARDFPTLSTITGTGSQNVPEGTPNPLGNGVYRARIYQSPAASTLLGCFLGDCDRTTGDTDTTYENGNTANGTIYVRYQLYRPSGIYYPTQLDNKILFLYPNRYTSRPDANIDAGPFFFSGTHCSGTSRNDALAFRVGSNSGSFKSYPAANNGGVYNSHFEYCSGTGAPNGQFGDSTVAHCTMSTAGNCTNDPDPGTLYRWRKDRWHTIEFRYTLSTAGTTNGIIEAWVDGVKVYSNSDLETCGGYGATQGSCSAVYEIQLLNYWVNPNNATDTNAAQNADCGGGAGSCYSLIDNLVISQSYIGPPNESETSAAPAGLTISGGNGSGVSFR